MKDVQAQVERLKADAIMAATDLELYAVWLELEERDRRRAEIGAPMKTKMDDLTGILKNPSPAFDAEENRQARQWAEWVEGQNDDPEGRWWLPWLLISGFGAVYLALVLALRWSV